MKVLIDRLAKLNADAEAISKEIADMEDGEVILLPLYNVESSVKEVIGDLMLRAHRKGDLHFQETALVPSAKR